MQPCNECSTDGRRPVRSTNTSAGFEQAVTQTDRIACWSGLKVAKVAQIVASCINPNGLENFWTDF